MEIFKKIFLAFRDTALFCSDHNPTQTPQQKQLCFWV